MPHVVMPFRLDWYFDLSLVSGQSVRQPGSVVQLASLVVLSFALQSSVMAVALMLR